MIFRAAVLAAAFFAASPTHVFAEVRPFRCETDGLLRNGAPLGRLRAKVETGRPVAILAIGSSSTQGAGASGPAAAYPARLEERLRSMWPAADIRVVNAGKGGETAEQTLDRLSEETRSRSYDVVIWQVGTNDAARGHRPEGFADIVRRGVAVIRDGGAFPLLVDQQFYPKIEGSAVYARFVDAVAAVSDETAAPLHSRFAMMKRWRERGEGELLRGLAADGFHMSDAGYSCMAEGLASDIATMVGTPDRIGVTSARAR